MIMPFVIVNEDIGGLNVAESNRKVPDCCLNDSLLDQSDTLELKAHTYSELLITTAF